MNNDAQNVSLQVSTWHTSFVSIGYILFTHSLIYCGRPALVLILETRGKLVGVIAFLLYGSWELNSNCAFPTQTS